MTTETFDFFLSMRGQVSDPWLGHLSPPRAFTYREADHRRGPAT